MSETKTGYRIEYASSARAGCKGPKPCNGTKLAKGELRFGSIIDFQGKTSYAWRHYGCVTTKIWCYLKNTFSEIDELDGFEDLRPKDQEKVRKAYKNGHVDPADVPESAQKPEGDDEKSRRVCGKLAAKKDEDEDCEEAEEKPRRKRAPPGVDLCRSRSIVSFPSFLGNIGDTTASEAEEKGEPKKADHPNVGHQPQPYTQSHTLTEISKPMPLGEGVDPAALFRPYATVLGTNYVAEGQDCRAVRKILSTAKAEFSRLDEVIAWAKSRQATIEKFSVNYEALIGPIRRVPDDVLRELMVHCIASDWMGGKRSPAWTMSQVCQRWRSIALSTPRLWSYISFNCKTWSQTNSNVTTMHTVNQMLDRSKRSVLSIELAGGWGNTAGRGLWHLIFAQSERIVFLRVTVSYEVDSPISEYFPHSFPILQSLEVYETRSFETLFQKCLRLKDVHLSNIGDSWGSFKELQLPWAQLTSVAIQHNEGDADEILALLKGMRCLEKLTLSVGLGVRMPSDVLYPVDEIITLSKLRRLFLRVHDLTCATYIARSLLLPVLEELGLDARLDAENSTEETPIWYKRFYGQLASLLISSGCSVTRFTVIDDDSHCNVATLALNSMPDLESFRHFSSAPGRLSKYTGCHILSAFSKESNKSLPFPRLKVLDISGISLGDKADVIVRALQNRSDTFQTLRLHLLDTTIAHDPSDLTEFSRLGAQGVNIDIRSDKNGTLKLRTETRRGDRLSLLSAQGDKGFLWTKFNGEH